MATKKTKSIKRETLTYEEQIQRKLGDAKGFGNSCPEPTYFWNVGDKVRVGALNSPVVKEVLEDGKFYVIEDYSGNIKVFAWHNCRRIEKQEHDSLINFDPRYRLQYSNTVLSALLSKAYFFGTDFDPEYQRDYVWTDKDRELLIDSIFHGIDIGKFLFIRLPTRVDSPGYEIVDGKQRMNTIMMFFEDRLKYKGLTYSELSNHEQYFFKDYPVAICELEGISKEDILNLFIRINVAGKAMSQEQIDHAAELLKKEIESNA